MIPITKKSQNFTADQINGPNGVDHRHHVDDDVGKHGAEDSDVVWPYETNQHFDGPDTNVEGWKNSLELRINSLL
jgi:hypothetical protein